VLPWQYVAAETLSLESFSSFLPAVFLARMIPISLCVVQASSIAAFSKTSQKWLMSTIGLIMILKQILYFSLSMISIPDCLKNKFLDRS
jgi:hypothetical protein